MTEASTQFVDRRTDAEKAAGLLTQTLYWYDADAKGRRRTNAMAITQDGLLLVSRATCSKKDNFEKRKGRNMAGGRLLNFERLMARGDDTVKAIKLDGGPNQPEEAARLYLLLFPGDERGSKRAYNAGKIWVNYISSLA